MLSVDLLQICTLHVLVVIDTTMLYVAGRDSLRALYYRNCCSSSRLRCRVHRCWCMNSDNDDKQPANGSMHVTKEPNAGAHSQSDLI